METINLGRIIYISVPHDSLSTDRHLVFFAVIGKPIVYV
jgi:hypothetical protein